MIDPQAASRRHSLVGPAALWEMKRNFQISFLRSMGLQTSHSFLDLGCGTLRGGIPIIALLEPGHYCGVSKLDLNRQFDFVWAFSVLIHMTDEILDEALLFVSRHLAPGGVFYANVNIGEMMNGAWREFPLTVRSQEFYAHACRRAGLQMEDLGPLENFGHNADEAFRVDRRMLKINYRPAYQS